METEDKLIKRIENGDISAVDELIRLYYPEILRYCSWHAPNISLAEDATQETFLKIIRYLDKYVHKGKFKSFLYQIAVNTCIDMQRKKWLVNGSLEELTSDMTYTETDFDDIKERMELKRIIQILPQEQQIIMILRFSQDLTLSQTAKILNLPLRTVQSRQKSAIKRIKKEMEGGKWNDE